MGKNNFVIGQSTAFLDAVEQASRAASLNRPVLVIGERGTGKELIAERLHRLSSRWASPLVTLNCATLPENLIESELFGYEAGAFTGAMRAKTGRFEQAEGGTLFLDELATLSSSAQERLLRAVEYGEINRIGSIRPTKVDVRIVAATNEDLPSLTARGQFRSDLLDRLSFEVITLPPLRYRQEDIPLLAEYFGRHMALELGWDNWLGFTEEAMAILKEHSWPGNVRELRNVVERSLYRWGDATKPINHIVLDPFTSPWRPVQDAAIVENVTVKDTVMAGKEVSLPPSDFIKKALQDGDLKALCQDYERHCVEQALQRHCYNQRATAKALHLSYDQLRHILRRYDLLPAGNSISQAKKD
ncbi:phage shock protein operon transcriptional activator [Zymomonas mobilis]|uniref:phage shock protein operon transcriptional activator n=1 Tax=Zymomonas mobilis TaxID=542 RepID=UPI0021C3C07B|nr:phage shock protein operon transcriptional activator [Zymomonas mobilis]MCP9307669.1 phage shock protein operon transcriptional activator [Zymomonas mobilis]